MKRIWASSDLHGMLEGLTEPETSPKGCDLAVIAGDFAPLGHFETWQDQVRWFIGSGKSIRRIFGDVPIVLVPGNHDLWLGEGNLKKWNAEGHTFPFGEETGIWLLVDQAAEVAGVKLYGTPWVPYINGRWAYEAPYSYDHDDGFLAGKFAAIPEGLDVLVTHGPPLIRHATVDVSTFHGKTTRHFGSRELTAAIERARPRYVLSGHIHSGTHDAVVLDDCITVRNVSRVDEEYRIAYDPAIVEIP